MEKLLELKRERLSSQPAPADVVIVVPPFATASYPPLGAALINGACKKAGVRSVVFYGNLHFAALLGWRMYEHIAASWLPHLAVEALFAPNVFPCSPDPLPLLIEASRPNSRFSGPSRNHLGKDELMACRAVVESFLREAVLRIGQWQPRIVGFSSTVRQTFASLALARRIKECFPGTRTVMGGYNTRKPMGPALSRITDAVDCVFIGEAEQHFPQFCLDLLQAPAAPLPPVVDCGTAPNLQDVPAPDYDDYFGQLGELRTDADLPASWPVRLGFSSGRGCWWGECRFCGLNGHPNVHRARTAAAVVEEISCLAQRHNVYRFEATDTIMPQELMADLPAPWKVNGFQLEIQYEVRASLSGADLARLAASGVRTVQAGVESFSTAVLRAMKKGTKGIENIRFLRDALATGTVVLWNYLYGFPGESSTDYEELCELLPLVEHLQPPQTWGPIRIDRDSEYFLKAKQMGIRNVRPHRNLALLFPEGSPTDELSLWFEADWDTELLNNEKLLQRMTDGFRRWFEAWCSPAQRPLLSSTYLPSGKACVIDTRSKAREPVHVLEANVAKVLAGLSLGTDSTAIRRNDELSELLSRELVIEMDDTLLALPAPAATS